MCTLKDVTYLTRHVPHSQDWDVVDGGGFAVDFACAGCGHTCTVSAPRDLRTPVTARTDEEHLELFRQVAEKDCLVRTIMEAVGIAHTEGDFLPSSNEIGFSVG